MFDNIACLVVASEQVPVNCLHTDEVTHLDEREEEAHGEVGQPVHGAGDHEGGRSVGLFEQFTSQDEGDATWQTREETYS